MRPRLLIAALFAGLISVVFTVLPGLPGLVTPGGGYVEIEPGGSAIGTAHGEEFVLLTVHNAGPSLVEVVAVPDDAEPIVIGRIGPRGRIPVYFADGHYVSFRNHDEEQTAVLLVQSNGAGARFVAQR